MACASCGEAADERSRECPSCGHPLHGGLDDASETTVWAPEIDAFPARRRRRLAIVAVVGVLAIGALVTWRLAAAPSDARRKRTEARVPTTAGEANGVNGDAWWTPPAAKRVSVEALAYAFATVDERDLGALFDKDLRPVYGMQKLYEVHEARRLRRDELFHSMTELRNTLQLEAGFNFLIARAGAGYNRRHEYLLYRAMQVREVVSVDESRRMKEPPGEAVFYLAEVHRGHAYDMLVEDDSWSLRGGLDLRIKVPVDASVGVQVGKLRVTAQGLGMEPIGGDAIFARTPRELQQGYRTSGNPVPVKLVFRTIPGRSAKERRLPTPEVVVDETWRIADGARESVPIGQGRYRIGLRSAPKGVRLVPDGHLACSKSIPARNEYTSFEAVCESDKPLTVHVENYRGWGPGPTEQVEVLITRLP